MSKRSAKQKPLCTTSLFGVNFLGSLLGVVFVKGLALTPCGLQEIWGGSLGS